MLKKVAEIWPENKESQEKLFTVLKDNGYFLCCLDNDNRDEFMIMEEDGNEG